MIWLLVNHYLQGTTCYIYVVNVIHIFPSYKPPRKVLLGFPILNSEIDFAALSNIKLLKWLEVQNWNVLCAILNCNTIWRDYHLFTILDFQFSYNFFDVSSIINFQMKILRSNNSTLGEPHLFISFW